MTYREVKTNKKERIGEEKLVGNNEGMEITTPFEMDANDIGYQEEQPEQVLSQMDLKMIQYINERLNVLKEENIKEIGFFSIVEGETKENKIKAFQELLSLEAKDVISMTQDEPFGDIKITQID